MSSVNQVFAHQREIAKQLASKFDEVLVLTFENSYEKYSLPENMRVVSLNWTPGKPFRNLVTAYFFLFRELHSFKPDSVFYHMTDFASALFSPIFFLKRTKQVLWYAHISNSKWLRFAYFFVDEIATSTIGSFPKTLNTKNVIGQSIDTNLFSFIKMSEPSHFCNLVHVGRLDPSKNIEEILKWSKEKIRDKSIKSLTLIGQPTSTNMKYITNLINEYREYFDAKSFNIRKVIPNNLLPTHLALFDIFIHCFQGSLDKSVLEATAIGIPVISTNGEYLREFGSWSTEGSSLDAQFNALLRYSEESLQDELERRRNLVVRNHSLDSWITKMALLLEV